MTSLSIVLCATGSRSLAQALDAVTSQAGSDRAELILAARRGEAGVADAAAPGWRVVWVGPERTLGQLLLDGLRAATGSVVAITTDRFVVAPDWVARVREAHGQAVSPAVVAGIIDVADDAPLVTRAVYGCEYAALARRSQRAATAAPAANLSLAREAVETLVADTGHGWDAGWFARFRESGVDVALDRERRVTLSHRFTTASFLRERFHFSRTLSGLRAQAWSPGRRVLRAGLMLGLPVVLAARCAADIAGLQRPLPVFRAFPVVLLFILSWALGDIVGVLRGPGHSPGKVG